MDEYMQLKWSLKFQVRGQDSQELQEAELEIYQVISLLHICACNANFVKSTISPY